MKMWTLAYKAKLHQATCGISYVSFSLMFKTKREADLYRSLRNLHLLKAVKIDVAMREVA